MELTLRDNTDAFWNAVFSPDGTRIATASANGTVKIWDATTGKELLTVNGSTEGVSGFMRRLARMENYWQLPARTILLVSGMRTGEELLALSGIRHEVYQIEFSPDGSRLATISSDGY